MRNTIFIFLNIFNLSLIAQLPWNAKFVLKNPSGLTDTVWVGCDENADIGYQAGYDSLNTNFFPPVSIAAYDEEVENEFGFGTCVNLKKDIKNFVDTGTVEFEFYVLTDVYPSGLDTFSISWDTTDFKYNENGNRITYAAISSAFGYILAIDADYIIFEYIDIDYLDTSYGFLEPPFAALYPFDSINSCSNGAWAMKLTVTVAFNVYSTPINENYLSEQISLYPNPFHNLCCLKNESDDEIKIEIFNVAGNKVFVSNVAPRQFKTLELENLPKGLYTAKYSLQNNLPVSIQKIIKI